MPGATESRKSGPGRRRWSLLGPVLFLTLLAASLGTTFYVIRDKTPDLMLEVVEMTPRRFSPNADGRRDEITLRFFIRTDESAARIEIIHTLDNSVVRTLAESLELDKNEMVALTWDGLRDDGRPMRDGSYRLRVVLPESGRTIVFPRRFFLERSS